MSRYIARVRQHDTLTAHFACDSLHVDDGGNLSLNLQHSPDEVITVARFQHGHWASYELDLVPETETAAPNTDSLAAAVRFPRVNDAVHLLAPGRPGCTVAFVHRVEANGCLVVWPEFDAGPYPREVVHDETQQAEFSWHWPCDEEVLALPGVGDVVHIYDAARSTCLPGPVISVNHTALEVEAGDNPRFPRYITIHHDETRTIDHSWHRPCGRDDQGTAAAPTPPVVVTVHIDEAQILRAITDQRIGEFLRDKQAMDRLARSHQQPWPH